MKKTRSRLLSLLLAVILIASAIPVQAASSDIAPYRYDYVSSCSIFLNKRNWDYVTSWDTSGSSSLVLEKSYYVMSGYYYKAELSADVYNSSGSFLENVTSTSSIKYY